MAGAAESVKTSSSPSSLLTTAETSLINYEREFPQSELLASLAALQVQMLQPRGGQDWTFGL